MNAIIAIALVTGSVGLPELWDEEVVKDVRALVLDWELVDDRELRYMLVRPEDYQHDIDVIRGRWRVLRDVPRLDTVWRLPERGAVQDGLTLNRAFKRYLEAKLVMYPDGLDDIQEAIRETEALYTIWDSMRDARSEFMYVSTRRVALSRVPEIIPPCVPIWRFYEE